MKSITFLLLLLHLQVIGSSQTAEEILWKTQGAYRALSNYVDEDTFVVQGIFPSTDTLIFVPVTLWYVMALDRKQNVNYWHQRHLDDETIIGYYKKSEKEANGILYSNIPANPDIICSLAEAAARLSGRNNSRLSLIASLMYPDLRAESVSDSSIILDYDSASRLADTTINGSSCYVVKTKKTNIITQERADKANYQKDSINGLLTLDPELRGGPRMVAGPVTVGRKYYIRKTDFIILRIELFNYKEDTETKLTQATVTFKPKLNVEDFKKYMEE
jgi:hypothetical protein